MESAYSLSRSLRVEERHDGLGHVEPVDQVVQDGLRSGVLEEVRAVVHDQQRVRRGAPEAGRQVDRDWAVAPQRPAPHRQLHELAGAGVGVGHRPLGRLVARAEADRRGADRAVGELLVERVVEALDVVAAPELDLVVDPGALRQLEHEVPQVGVPQTAQREALGQPDDPLHDVHLVGLAAEQERAAAALDDGDLVPGEEAVDRRVRRAASAP